MTKRPLPWHKACLKNMALSVEADLRAVEKAAARISKAERELEAYAKQIAEAERRGLDAFDSERFLVARKVKVGE